MGPLLLVVRLCGIQAERRWRSSWNLPTPTSMCAFRRRGGVGTGGCRVAEQVGRDDWQCSTLRLKMGGRVKCARGDKQGRAVSPHAEPRTRPPDSAAPRSWMLSHSRRATKPPQTLAELLMQGRHVSLFFTLFSCSLRRSHSHVRHRWGGRPYKKGLLLRADSASSCRCDTWFMRSQKTGLIVSIKLPVVSACLRCAHSVTLFVVCLFIYSGEMKTPTSHTSHS